MALGASIRSATLETSAVFCRYLRDVPLIARLPLAQWSRCRYHDLRLTAVEARVHFLANFLEVCRLNHHGCPWSLRRITNESRVGELTGGLHPDYQASGVV